MGKRLQAGAAMVIAGACLALAMGCPPSEPRLAVSTNERNFGSALSEMTFTITNTGGGALEWSLSCAEAWISLAPTSGTNDDTVTVTVDRSSPALGLGLNWGMIRVDTDVGDELISVTVIIGSGEGEGEGEDDPALSFWPEELHFGADSESTLTIMNAGGGTLDWTLSPDAVWLDVDRASGSGLTSVSVTIDRTGLSNGLHETTLAVASNGGDAAVPVSAFVYDTGLDYGLPAYWPFAEGNEWTWSKDELLWKLTITDAFTRNSVPVWAFRIDDNWGTLGDYYFVYADAQLYVLSDPDELDDLPYVPYMSCRTWDGSCSFPLFEDDLTPGDGYDPFYSVFTTYAPESLGMLLDFFGVYEADYALADFPVGNPDDCIGFTWTEGDATTVYHVFAPGIGPVVWDSWRLRHAIVGAVEYGEPMEFGPGLGVSEDPDSEVLYYARQPDGTFVSYFGYEESGNPQITHAVVEDAFGVTGGAVIVNEDFVPVQWLFEGLTVAAFDLPPEGWDPEVDDDWMLDLNDVRHVALSGAGRQEFNVNLNPGHLEFVLFEFEDETGEDMTFAHDFLDRAAVTTWTSLVNRAHFPAPDQPLYQAAAVGFGAITAVARMEQLGLGFEKAGEEKVLYFSLWQGVAKSLIYSAIQDEICFHCPEPGDRSLDVVICQGSSGMSVLGIEICHYCFFWTYPLTNCTAFCHASLNCFTSICAPTQLSVEWARSWALNRPVFLK